jgi:hypothetical protein
MFVHKVFQLVKPSRANLHATRFQKYSYMYVYPITLKIINLFFCIKIKKKYADFYADFESVEINGKNVLKKSYLPKSFAS